MAQSGKYVGDEGIRSQSAANFRSSFASTPSPAPVEPPPAADVTNLSEATDTLSKRRRWASFTAIFALLIAAAGFWFAQVQTATLPRSEPTEFWIDFWQPRETNRWKRLETSNELFRPTVQAVTFSSDGKTVLAVGNKGTVLQSVNAGQTWQVVAAGDSTRLQSVAFAPNGKTALAVGEGGKVLQSLDAGKIWQTIASIRTAWLQSVAFTPQGKTALAVGQFGTVLQSLDEGKSWQVVASGSTEWLKSVAFAPNGKTALAVGHSGTVLQSLNAGQTWQTIAIGSKESLNSVAFAPDGTTALAVGSGGTVLQSLNSGQTWTKVTISSETMLSSVTFSPDGKTALAVDNKGSVLRSLNSGQTWLAVASGRQETLYATAFAPDGGTALAVGTDGTVVQSLDAGQTWQPTALYAKTTAPWYDALLTLLALSCGAIGLFLFRPGRTWTERLGLMNNAVTDKPIEKVSEDRLAFTPVVEAVSTFLRHSGTRPSLAIAINAPWGMGKSSFMNMLSTDLSGHGTRPVHFNVWHHQHEEVLLAPLLQAIVSQAIPGWGCWAGWRFRARLWRGRYAKGGWAFRLGSCALLTVPAYALWLGLWAWDSGTAFPLAMIDRSVRDVHALGTLLTGGVWQASVKNGSLGDLAAAAFIAFRSEPVNALIVLGLVLFVASWVLLFSYTLRPFPASPAILVASMEKRFSLSKAEAQTDFRQRFRRHFGQVARALQPRAMVIFIDDLDRCKPEKAAELLEAANYLSDAGPCFLILGVARDIVEAQVANAHKVVAEEQAAMKRVRDGATTPAPANSDADRLAYAQKYLRKLVQLDIALPRLDAQRSIQILLGKLEVDVPAVASQPPKKSWLSPAAWSSVLTGSMAIGIAALVVWRTYETLPLIRTEQTETAKNQAARVAGLRINIEEARLYAAWLNDMASAKPIGSEKLLPSPMLYKARADMMQTVVRDLDSGLALLEREAPEGQRKTFNGLYDKVFRPGYDVFTAHIREAQFDGRNWQQIKMGLWPPGPITVSWDLQLGATTVRLGSYLPAQAPPRPIPIQPVKPMGVPWGHLTAGLLPALLLLWFAFRAKDDYIVQPTPEYEEAVRVWQQELLRNPDTASPREMKRFMNLSRYAVARLQAVIKNAPKGTPLPISETCIVELTAKWLSRDRALSASDLRKELRKNDAKKEEVELFLEIVGDLSEGGTN